MVKEFVRSKCSDELTIPTIAVFNNSKEIDVTKLSKPCVIKPSHSSGSVVFVEKGQESLSPSDREILDSALRSSPYSSSREANYRFLRKRFICEPTLSKGEETKDYKFFCYQGIPLIVQVDSERRTAHKRNIYKADWVPLDIEYNFPIGEWEPPPRCLPDMVEAARVLAADFEFVRVDFFIDGDNFYVGELTHCPESAHGRFGSRESEDLFSSILFAASVRP